MNKELSKRIECLELVSEKHTEVIIDLARVVRQQVDDLRALEDRLTRVERKHDPLGMA